MVERSLIREVPTLSKDQNCLFSSSDYNLQG